MNRKRIVGLVVTLVGIVFVIFAVYTKQRIAEVRGDVEKITTPFSKNPVGKFMSNDLNSRIGWYEQMVKWCLFGGITLVVVGGVVTVFARKR